MFLLLLLGFCNSRRAIGVNQHQAYQSKDKIKILFIDPLSKYIIQNKAWEQNMINNNPSWVLDPLKSTGPRCCSCPAASIAHPDLNLNKTPLKVLTSDSLASPNQFQVIKNIKIHASAII